MKRSTVAWSALPVAAFWLHDFWRREISLISVVVGALWLVLARRKLSRWAIAGVVLACPLVALPLAAVFGTGWDYFSGKARLPSTTWGYPGWEAANLDPVRRVFPKLGGGNANFSRLLLAGVERSTLDGLLGAFGPMRGAYQGPYPNKTESLAAVEARGWPLAFEDFRRGAFVVGDRSVNLDSRAVARLRGTPADPLRATVIEHQVLLIRAEREGVVTVDAFDLGGFGWFATYRYERPTKT